MSSDSTRSDVIVAEVGTTDTYETIRVSGDVSADLAQAVVSEHSGRDGFCTDSSCDIRAALESGSPIAAAWLLQGATETPLIDAVVRYYELTRDDPRSIEDDTRWTEYFHANGVECECGSFVFPDEDGDAPTQCSNCLAYLPREDLFYVQVSSEDEPRADEITYQDAVTLVNLIGDEYASAGWNVERGWASSGNYLAIRVTFADNDGDGSTREVFIAIEREEV